MQFAGREIRVLDYIEGVGQPLLAYYAHELRRRGWKDAVIYLPHDGVLGNPYREPPYTQEEEDEIYRRMGGALSAAAIPQRT